MKMPSVFVMTMIIVIGNGYVARDEDVMISPYGQFGKETAMKAIILSLLIGVFTTFAQAQSVSCVPNSLGGQNCSNGTSSFRNTLGGQNYSNGASSYRNSLGGQNYSNGLTSTPNSLGGQNYSNGVSSSRNALGGLDYSNGRSCIPNSLGGMDCR